MQENENKHIADLHIQNFGCFDDIKIDGLKRINVICGANSTGKTWLLRAINLYIYSDNKENQLKALFIILRGLSSQAINNQKVIEYKNNFIHQNCKINNEKIIIDDVHFLSLIDALLKGLPLNILQNIDYAERDNDWHFISKLFYEKCNTQSIRKEILTNIIQKFEPNVQNLYPDETDFARLELKNQDKDINFSYFGYGVKRSVILYFLSYINKDNIVGIDEAENGLHYDLQKDVINSIIDASLQYNNQLFITTHSKEYLINFLDIIEEKKMQDDICFINMIMDFDNKITAETLSFEDGKYWVNKEKDSKLRML